MCWPANKPCPLEKNGFKLFKEKGSIRYYMKPGWEKLVRVDFKYSPPDLEGFTGIGHSIEDCLYKAKWGMIEHVKLLREAGLPVPAETASPRIIIQNQPTTKVA